MQKIRKNYAKILKIAQNNKITKKYAKKTQNYLKLCKKCAKILKIAQNNTK